MYHHTSQVVGLALCGLSFLAMIQVFRGSGLVGFNLFAPAASRVNLVWMEGQDRGVVLEADRKRRDTERWVV